jgi:hypothetical protein
MNMLQQYLAEIQEQLPFGGSRQARTLSEIETHLRESWEAEQKRGLSEEKALKLVLERFGSSKLIGRQFAQLEMERRFWQGKQCWQRAGLFLAPLLLCYAIAALGFLGYDIPRQVFIHLTNDLGNWLSVIHLHFVGILLLGWLILGGPLACTISGIQGIVSMRTMAGMREIAGTKDWSRVIWLNTLWVILGLTLLLFEIFSLITD